MNKAGVLAVAMVLAGLTTTEATAQGNKPVQQKKEQSSTWEQTAQQASQPLADYKKEEVKEKIFKRQLPAPVQQVLLQDALAGWKLNDIFKIAPDTVGQRIEYEIYFTNASQQKGRIRVDEVGDIVMPQRDTAAVKENERAAQDTLNKE